MIECCKPHFYKSEAHKQMYQELWNELKNTSVLWDSLQNIWQNFSANTVIMGIMMIFCVIGGIDKIRGNRHGYGAKFDEAFAALKPLALTMIGVITLVPILQLLLEPLIIPVYEFFGASPAMFAGTVFPVDSGAYPLALQLGGSDASIANFSGVVLGGTLGCLFIGTIPICMSMLEKEDHDCFAMAVLVAVITIPLGCIAGGLAMNLTPYKLPMMKMLVNLIPVIIVAGLVALGLALRPQQVMRGFCAFGNLMQVVLTLCILMAAVQSVTGLRLPVFRLMVEPAVEGGVSPLVDSFIIVGTIVLILAGAFPMVLWISRVFKKPILKLSHALGMNEAGGAGLIASLASLFPALDLVRDMNTKGKLLVLTFSVSAAFVFGDHLGFTAGVNQDMVLPLIASKLVGGITAMILANILAPRLMKKEK